MASRVLIVEDEPAQRRILEEMVKRFGFDVSTADSGMRALEQLRGPQGGTFELVILDLVMPEMDGITAVRQIMSMDPNAKIIMCTSMGQQALVVEAIQAGAKSFITKPFQPPKILETISKVLA